MLRQHPLVDSNAQETR